MHSLKLLSISAILLFCGCTNDLVSFSSKGEGENYNQFKSEVMQYDSVVYTDFEMILEATNPDSDDSYWYSSKSATVSTSCPPTGRLEVDLSDAEFGDHRIDLFLENSDGVQDTFTLNFTYRDTTVYDFAPLVVGNWWTYEHRYAYHAPEGSSENIMEYSLEVTEIVNDTATISLETSVLTEGEEDSWSETVRLSTTDETVNFSIEGVTLFLNRSYSGNELSEHDGKPFELYLQETIGGSQISCFMKDRGLLGFSAEHSLSERESAEETVVLKRFNGTPVDIEWIVEHTSFQL